MVSPLFEDWQAKVAYPKSIWNLFVNQVGCDVVFEVGPDLERIGAHSTVLMSRSCELFAELVAGPPAFEIQLPEYQPEEFSSFLEYLYTGELKTTGINIVQILGLAEKYKVGELERKLVTIQLDSMEIDKFCPFVRKNENHMTDLIKFKCLEYVFRQPRPLFTSNSFQLLPRSFLQELLAHNRLVLDEEIICNAMLGWASKECEINKTEVNGENQRKMLGDTLYEIRFPLLSQEYFTEKISEKGVLLYTEEVQILKYFLNPQKPVDEKFKFKTGKRISPPGAFKYSPTRQLPHDGSLRESFSEDPDIPIVHTLSSGMQGYVERFGDYGSGWGYKRDKQDAIIIVASRDIRLDYVYIFGNCRADGTLDVTLKIQDDKTNTISSSSVKIQTLVKQPKYEVGVENAEGSYGVHLNANEEYHIILTIKGENTYYGKSGRNEASDREVLIKFKESRFSTNSTGISIGQIAALKFTLV